MLLATVNPKAAAAIGSITKVGVGNSVVYHARAGYVRERRSSFPAFVMRQHEDGTLDLFVIMEREDFAWEERIAFQSHNQPHHCWSAVTDVPEALFDGSPVSGEEVRHLYETIAALTDRLTALEAKRKPGRPPNPK